MHLFYYYFYKDLLLFYIFLTVCTVENEAGIAAADVFHLN